MSLNKRIADLLGDSSDGEAKSNIVIAKKTLGEGFGGDVFNGHAFAEAHRGKLIYVPEAKQWLDYDGVRWVPCEPGNYMQEFAASAMIKAVKAEMKSSRRGKALSEQMTLLLKVRARQTAALASASELPTLRVKAAGLDADPWLMGVPNGVLDLCRGRLVAAEPGQWITKQAGAPFDPDASAPRWRAFLKRALPDPEVRAFARRAVGYSLIGVVDEEKLFFAHGPGASGKSTFANVVEALFGDYAVAVNKALLVRGQFSDSEAERQVTRLHGVRLASINETSRGDVFDDYKIKKITSRERIAARRLYSEAFDFMPTHTSWLRGNFLPGVQDAGDGFWRRLVPIEFGVQIPAAERIADLDRQIIADELPGVLAWAVRGALEWKESGLGIPEPIRLAVESYRESTDLFGAWLDECTKRIPTAKTKTSDLFDSWTMYCHSNGAGAGYVRAFGDELVRRGYERDKSRTHGRRFMGIALTGGFDALD
ncbi:phage/plasmid primase, P4 family [Hyphomonas sp. ND6WE1B]|uniref:DNA primase family protein n=1 Tax=Hyphomonas sp. ND6WE1B TaxID=1848191 RepID=UPI0008076198|nr:phage/plasmid primase, P4 family [Hyphomonas sp. ND6WE1B]